MGFDIQDIKKIVYDDIKTAIGAAIGNRISNKVSDKNFTLPHCVYSVIASPPTHFSCCNTTQMHLQINLYSYLQNGMDSLTAINDTLYNYLEGHDLPSATFPSSYYSCIDRYKEDWSDDLIGVQSEYLIHISNINNNVS